MTPALPPGPIAGPSAWTGRDLAPRPDEWIRRFTPAELAEIDAAVRGFEASGSALAEISPASFPLPTFGPVLRNLLRELLDDRGFFMLRGLPNWPEPERHRHLLRLWLAPREARPLPEIFAPRYGSVVPGRRGGIVMRGTKAPLEAE